MALDSLAADVYSVTVTDANGCVLTLTDTVLAPWASSDQRNRPKYLLLRTREWQSVDRRQRWNLSLFVQLEWGCVHLSEHRQPLGRHV